MLKQVGLIICLACVLTTSSGQSVAVKTNLLHGAGMLTPNLGVEIALGQRTTLDLSGGYNWWNRKGSEDNNKKFLHYLVQPEFRYWLCQKYSGHFFGIHTLFLQYNIGGHHIPLLLDREFRYEGTALGGGISYGYHWIWNRHWGAEFTVGVGAARLNYDKYDCATCGSKIGNFQKTYFGPTKAGVTLIYIIK